MAVISINSLRHIPTFTYHDSLDGQLRKTAHEELLDAVSPSPFALLRYSLTQPLGSQYCGAYSLTAAAATFGQLPISSNNPLASGKHALAPEDDFTTITMKLFQHTRFTVKEIANLFEVSEKSIPSDFSKGGNIPAKMLTIAQNLGLKAELKVTDKTLKYLKKKAIPSMKKQLGSTVSDSKILEFLLGKQQAFMVSETPMGTPKADSIHLVVVQTVVESLHWIALSSDNTYFDSLRDFYPGKQFGVIGNPWAAKPYYDTGIWLELRATDFIETTSKPTQNNWFKFA